MKYKLKTKLFAALAISGASFYGPTFSSAFAQDNDYGFIRSIEPQRAVEVAEFVEEAAMELPPIVHGTISPAPVSPSGVSGAPMPFAASNVYAGSFIPDTPQPGVGSDELRSAKDEPAVGQVGYTSTPQEVNELPPIVSGLKAERDVPPIIQRVDQSLPKIVEAVPPIRSVEVVQPPTGRPLLAPLAFSNRQEEPEAVTADGSMVQNTFLMNADGASATEDPQEPAVKSTSFASSAIAMQDAPPIISGSVEGVASVEGELPGSIPSGGSGTRSLLAPIDPVAPSASDLPTFGVVGNGIPVAPVQSMPVEAPLFSPSAIDAPAVTPIVGGCATCGGVGAGCGCQGSGVSTCSSCGDGGCCNPGEVAGMFSSCGSNSMARRYFIADALYLDRDDGNIQNSNFGSLSNFDPGAGWRMTFGRRQDSTRGREITYMGTTSIEQNRTNVQPSGILQSRFVPFDGFSAGDSTNSASFTPGNVRAFFNATFQEESKETFFHSLELNRVKWGWDVMKSFVGLRYMLIDDRYNMVSQSQGLAAIPDNPVTINDESVPARAASVGSFEMHAMNHLIGPQIGAELFYDVGYRWSLSGFSKAGIFANINEIDTQVVVDGTTLVNSEDSNATIAGMYEAGIIGKYRLTRQAQLRLGYNILWLGDVASVADNFTNILSPSIGSGLGDEDDMFFHGLSFGIELYR